MTGRILLESKVFSIREASGREETLDVFSDDIVVLDVMMQLFLN